MRILSFLGWPILTGILAAILILQLKPDLLSSGGPRVEIREADSSVASQSGPFSYADAVDQAAPAVVNIYTRRVNSDKENEDDNSIYRHYYDSEDPKAGQQVHASLGSGVIINDQGYVVTNNHVISGADSIIVALQDGREAAAKIVGTDPPTDIAVLKISLPDLPTVTLAPTGNLRVGDVVLAIGNPFGVGQAVTQGIISATDRNSLGLNTYEDFIQTDAAINQGNSGGALVDAEGNLIGINTAIFSQSGAAQGIGFAIPVRLAVEVMQAIIQHGHVIRGWLGVEVQPLTPELAESFGLEVSQGIVVASLYRNGPAWNAGLLPGDVILKIDGEPATSGRQAMNQVARAKPGEVTYGSGGNGTMNHLVGQLLALSTKAQLTHIPYRGSAPAMNDLMGGQITALMESLPTASGYFTSKRMKPLAVSEDQRAPTLPDVPTFREAGFPEVVATNWFGFSAPAGIPPEIAKRWEVEIAGALQSAEIKERFDKLGIRPGTLGAAGYTALIAKELPRWREVIVAGNIRAD